MEMEQSEYDALFVYLSKRVYSRDYDIKKKRVLRRKAESLISTMVNYPM